MKRKLTWDEFKAVFGKSTVSPDDTLQVNDQWFGEPEASSDGVTFTATEEPDDDEE